MPPGSAEDTVTSADSGGPIRPDSLQPQGWMVGIRFEQLIVLTCKLLNLIRRSARNFQNSGPAKCFKSLDSRQPDVRQEPSRKTYQASRRRRPFRFAGPIFASPSLESTLGAL